MADAYWRYTEGRQPPAAAFIPPPHPAVKRPRTYYPDVSSGPEMLGYYSRDEERADLHAIRYSDSLGASYDRYLRNGISSYGGGESLRPVPGGISGHAYDDRRVVNISALDNRNVGYAGGRSEPSLPPYASNTLFVEGLPADCSLREVSHIFRPFLGFREVRLVNKESRLPGADPLVLCFVDFATPTRAAIALEALQGYKFDEHDRDVNNLRLKFSRFPGPRSSWHRGRLQVSDF